MTCRQRLMAVLLVTALPIGIAIALVNFLYGADGTATTLILASIVLVGYAAARFLSEIRQGRHLAVEEKNTRSPVDQQSETSMSDDIWRLLGPLVGLMLIVIVGIVLHAIFRFTIGITMVISNAIGGSIGFFLTFYGKRVFSRRS